MSYRLGAFSGVGLTQAKVRTAMSGHEQRALPRLERLWTYYRNPLRPVGVGGAGARTRAGRWYALGQEAGLPARLRCGAAAHTDDRAPRREVVIENDIGWRVQAMVDFMFGKPVTMRSTGAPDKRALIDRAIAHMWAASGGIALLQDIALLGHVFGHVDLLLRVDEDALSAAKRAHADGDDLVMAAAGALRVEVVDPRRGIPLINSDDYRRLDAYIVRAARGGGHSHDGCGDESGGGGGIASLVRSVVGWARSEHHPLRAASGGTVGDEAHELVEIISADAWHVYRDGELAWERSRAWTPGEVPVVHIQNISQPLEYEGLGEVEPLIPLQDELNTRLSDRANRVTLQSFKMYLAKGVEAMTVAGGVSPGQVWFTDNMDASVQAFGGDAASPSEESHIREVREALDKASAVPPLSGGVVQGRIGNLSSATALRITLMGLTAKTARKRVTYGRGIAKVCALALSALDSAGVLATSESERGIELEWPDPLPEEIGAIGQAAKGPSDQREPVGSGQ